MTYREMFKKVDTYNEVDKAMLEDRPVDLRCFFGHGVAFGVEYGQTGAKAFRKYVTDTFITELAEAILTYKGYEFNSWTEISCKDAFGDTVSTIVSFYPHLW